MRKNSLCRSPQVHVLSLCDYKRYQFWKSVVKGGHGESNKVGGFFTTKNSVKLNIRLKLSMFYKQAAAM